jgi:fatty-acid desaturase
MAAVPPPADATKSRSNSRFYWLFLIPAIAVVIPQFFNFREPTLGGFPFFYWYQILWVFLTAGLTWLINRGEA